MIKQTNRKRWKRGDIHPETGLVFRQYDGTREKWTTSAFLARLRAGSNAAKKARDHAAGRSRAAKRAVREAEAAAVAADREADAALCRRCASGDIKWGDPHPTRPGLVFCGMRSGGRPDWRSVDAMKRKEASRRRRLFKVNATLRAACRRAFFLVGKDKNDRTQNLLGCSFDAARAWIEQWFTEGMSWENHGQWHIDHFVPLSSARDAYEARALCHYTNLRPLWEIDNLVKGKSLAHLSSPWPRHV